MTIWQGDARYTALVRERAPELVRLATLLVGNIHDAEDVVQDVLLAASRSWPFQKPVAYLRRSVANRAIDVLRKRRDLLTDEVPDTAHDDPGMLRTDAALEFFALVRALPERQRTAVVLKYFADLDDASIGRAMGISPNTVRSQIQHALSKLRADQRVEEDA